MKGFDRALFLTCALGYSLALASAAALWAVVRTVSYGTSFRPFALGLVTFRLVEIHIAFVAAPLLAAVVATAALSKMGISRKMAAGLGTASYYLLVMLLFVIAGGELPFLELMPWVLWTFILGALSSIIVERKLGQ